MTNHDDLALFQKMMSDIDPLEQNQIAPKKQSNMSKDSQLARRLAAISLSEIDNEYLSLDNAKMLAPNEIIGYRQDGVQEGVYRKLRLGKYPIQARLDLHKRTLENARSEILAFFRQSQRLDIRTVIIIHGKGANAVPPAMMKSYVSSWLSQIKEVMCYHSTQPHHGGSGALYVMLKKSAAKKLDNREHHQARRS
ncbi:DNA endonuclease SmrA [Vibrio sp. SS-MA-C1-2]|uniref:DNA endonuclease SmrA n=1 Tax=Vibrio sp. SS-MA-C1-2 TaxID=2908646 RepID=UPI001F2B08B0|nr:DNA endonuclease SmrA [Vibrio sp. SS-MA-C1-2]UJF18797.1 DNA endonuclease SmrA [Vibrio sp. SS-MA-C1-2]